MYTIIYTEDGIFYPGTLLGGIIIAGVLSEDSYSMMHEQSITTTTTTTATHARSKYCTFYIYI